MDNQIPVPDVSDKEVDEKVKERRKAIQENEAYNEEKRQKLLKVLEELQKFPLGRHLLVNQSLSGYWTDAIVNAPVDQIYPNKTEGYLFKESPPFAARRYGQQVIHKAVQEFLRPNKAVASIPCGLMSEVLLATSEPFSRVNLYAIDKDSENFDLIRKKYPERLVGNHFRDILTKDAVNLDYTMYKEWFDVICSIGFTMYLEKDEDMQKLFDGFYIALKKDGVLVTNFGTAPAEYNTESLAKLEQTYQLISALLILREERH